MKKILNKLFAEDLNIYLLLFLMIRLLFLFSFGDIVPQTKDYEFRYKILALPPFKIVIEWTLHDPLLILLNGPVSRSVS